MRFDRNIFGSPPVFSEVNYEIQKDIAVDTTVPALTWHMAFLIDKRCRSGIAGALDDLALRLIKGLHNRKLLRTSKHPIWPCNDDCFVLFNAVVTLEGENLVDVPDGQRSERVKRLLNAEERSIMIFWHWPDKKYGTKKITIKVKLFPNMFTISVVAEGPIDLQLLAFEKLTIDFWSDYSLFLFQLDPEIASAFGQTLFRPVFADLRGVVVRGASCAADIDAASKGGATWADGMLTPALHGALTHDDLFECTASYLLDGKILFASALGAQPLNYPDDKRVPLTYLMCVADGVHPGEAIVGGRQLGRVVERVHFIEVLRHAALLDLGLLRQASGALAAFDAATQRARTYVEDFSAGKAAERKEDTDGRDRAEGVALEDGNGACRNWVEQARADLNAIVNNFLNAERNIAGAGLTFRIESSRYYVSQMTRHLAALRIGRVEGYRPLDQFIDRKLGATFEFIDRLGYRYERATLSMASIEQTFATARGHKLGMSIEKIQRYGELALVCVLTPYYILGTSHLVGSIEQSPERALAVTVLLMIVVYGFGKFFHQDKRLQHIGTVGVLIIAWAATIALIYSGVTMPHLILFVFIFAIFTYIIRNWLINIGDYIVLSKKQYWTRALVILSVLASSLMLIAPQLWRAR